MRLFWTILKFILIWLVIAIIILAAAVFIANNILLGLQVLGVVFVIWLIFYIIYKIVKRQIAKKRIENMVNLERGEDSGQEEEEGSWYPFKEFFTEDRALYRRINKIVKFFHKSKLQLSDAAIYAKPWVLMFGEENSKKAMLLENAEIEFPIVSSDALKSDDGSIDFFLTNESIYIDTSSELYPGHGSKIPVLLVQILKALFFHRAKEPINSILLAVDASDLLSTDEDSIRKLAEKQRFYLHFFMLYLHARLPIYIVVTNSEIIEGFTQWTEILGADQIKEPLGNYIDKNIPTDEFVRNTIDIVCFRIHKMINLALLAKKKIDYKAMDFPNTLRKIEDGLSLYCKVIFVDNQYHESAILSGIYITGVKEKKGNPIVAFIHNLLTTIIPFDRNRIHNIEQMKRKTVSFSKSYFWLQWIGIFVVIWLAFWFFVFRNIDYIQELSENYQARVDRGEIIDYVNLLGLSNNAAQTSIEGVDVILNPEGIGEETFLTSDVILGIETMDYVANLVQVISDEEEGWWIPWNRLIGRYEIGRNLQYGFYSYVRNNLTIQIDTLLSNNIAFDFSTLQRLRLSEEQIDAQVANYALILYSRIAVLESALRGATSDELSRLPDPFILSDLYFRDIEGIIQDDVDKLNLLYIDSLLWREGLDNRVIQTELEDLQSLLQAVLTQGAGDLQWIVNWANQTLVAERISIEDYFLGNGNIEDPLFVSGAYTLVGENLIDDFVIKMMSMFPTDHTFYRRLLNFRYNYMLQYVSEWENFMSNAVRGTQRWVGRDEWFSGLQQLSGENNPYTNVMDTTYDNTQFILNDGLLYRSRQYLLQRTRSDQQEALENIGADESGTALPPPPEAGTQADSEIEAALPEDLPEEGSDSQEEIVSEIPDNTNNITLTLTADTPEDIEEMAIPEWIELIDYYKQAAQLSTQTTEGKNNSAITKLAIKTLGKAGKAGKTIAKTTKRVQKTSRKLRSNKKSADELQSNLESASQEIDNYILAMTDVVFQADSRAAMHRELESIFQSIEAPNEAQSGLGRMYGSIKNLQSLIGLETRLTKPFWDIIRAPIYTIEQYMVEEAQLEIQDRWETQVLLEVDGISSLRLVDVMFKLDSGLLWGFFNNNLSSFIQYTAGGAAQPIELTSGTSLYFHPEFLEYLRNGREGLRNNQATYPLVFEGGPISVNPDALFKPIKGTISMSCGERTYTLLNMNVNSRETMSWDPSCNDMSLTIDFSVFTATKSFVAPDGFPEFVSSFSGGIYRLTPDDFPEDGVNLRDINITEINLRYNIIGADDLIRGVNSFPTSVPNSITGGWVQ